MSARQYTIGQLSKASQTKTVTIRYYEQRGLLPVPSRTTNGYRIYKESDLDQLLFIRRSRDLGFSIESVRELLEIADQKDSSCADVNATVAQHLADVRKRLEQLRALEQELQRLSLSCQTEGTVGDCQIVEALSPKRNAL